MSATRMTKSEIQEFERLKLMIQQRHPLRQQAIAELLVLLGIWLPSEAGHYLRGSER